jgi:C_GCAxxG_C_C family probable redox protein
MSEAESAVSCFEEGFNCSQAVFSTYCPQFGLPRDMALKIAGAFGGGMGNMGKTCGAVTGAFMVIGLKHGTAEAGDEQAKAKVRELVREFVERFQSRNGSTECRELLGCDISTQAGLELAREKGLFTTLCPGFVRDAAEIIDQIV